MALTKEQIKEFETEENEAESSQEFRNIADQIADAGDKVWAAKVYKKSENKAKNINDLLCIAECIDDNLTNTEWVIKIYKKIEDKAETSSELSDLAEYINNLGNKEWTEKVYKKAAHKLERCYDLQKLAEDIFDKLGGSGEKLVREVYKKAEEKAEDELDKGVLADSIRETLEDEKWAKLLEKKAKNI